MKPCWKIWGTNATWRCVRDDDHPGGHQYVYIGRDARRTVYIGRDARRTEGNRTPESVNEGDPRWPRH